MKLREGVRVWRQMEATPPPSSPGLIEQAPVTIVGGGPVGIPAYFGYNYLVARIEKLVFRMEANSIAFMDILNQPVQK